MEGDYMENIFDLVKMRAEATLKNLFAALPDFGEDEVTQDQEEQPENEV